MTLRFAVGFQQPTSLPLCNAPVPCLLQIHRPAWTTLLARKWDKIWFKGAFLACGKLEKKHLVPARGRQWRLCAQGLLFKCPGFCPSVKEWSFRGGGGERGQPA